MTVTFLSAHRRLELKSDPRVNNSHPCAQRTLRPFCVVSHSCTFSKILFRTFVPSDFFIFLRFTLFFYTFNPTPSKVKNKKRKETRAVDRFDTLHGLNERHLNELTHWIGWTRIGWQNWRVLNDAQSARCERVFHFLFTLSLCTKVILTKLRMIV